MYAVYYPLPWPDCKDKAKAGLLEEDLLCPSLTALWIALTALFGTPFKISLPRATGHVSISHVED